MTPLLVPPAASGLIRQMGVFHARLLDPVYARRGDRRRVIRHKLREEWDVKNAAVYEGLNALLSAGFKGGTQYSTWYIGLVNNSGWSAFSANDTMASHAGWTEFQDYSQPTRPAWAPGTPASGALASLTVTTFTITSAGVLKGMFLTSNNTLGGATGVLWSTAQEGSTRNVTNGQSLQVLYTNTFTPVS